jgi:hypothetical protein
MFILLAYPLGAVSDRLEHEGVTMADPLPLLLLPETL